MPQHHWLPGSNFKVEEWDAKGQTYKTLAMPPISDCALIWNHGSEKAPGLGPQLDSVAPIFVQADFVVFAPIGRGHVQFT